MAMNAKDGACVKGAEGMSQQIKLIDKGHGDRSTLTKRLKAEAARVLAGVPSALKRPSGCSRARHRPHTFLLVSSELECRPYTLPHLPDDIHMVQGSGR